jgi:hypothetical protein
MSERQAGGSQDRDVGRAPGDNIPGQGSGETPVGADAADGAGASAGAVAPDSDPSAGAGTSPGGTPERDPADWVSGDEPMTGPQRSYLQTLGRETGEDAPGDLTKADASRLIDELQARTGRGGSAGR